MVWRRKQAKPIEDLPIEDTSSIEIVAHKDARREVKDKADEANAYMKKLLKEENHFTMTIVLALSGKQQKRRSG